MLDSIGASDIAELLEQVPRTLMYEGSLDIPGPLSEIDLLRHVSGLAGMNSSMESRISFLGAGIYDHYIPATVSAITGRSEFYTSYTPYQPEVSQGNLQSIFEFQTLVSRLTGMDVANASMYDGASALAEAALMATSITSRKTWVVSETVHPSYRETLQTYAWASGCKVFDISRSKLITDMACTSETISSDTACVIFQHPNFFGSLEDTSEFSRITHQSGALLIACVDPISLGLLKPPGEYSADVCVAEGQPLGISPGFGGPLLGIFACKRDYLRQMPGRLVGATTDAQGLRGYTLTLQTREQHIRRERATSNICTNEALCALAATVYLCTLGKSGLKNVAELCLQKTHYAARAISVLPGYEVISKTPFFKEFVVKCPQPVGDINRRLLERGIIGGLDMGKFYPELADHALLCITEKRTRAEIDSLIEGLSV